MSDQKSFNLNNKIFRNMSPPLFYTFVRKKQQKRSFVGLYNFYSIRNLVKDNLCFRN